MLDLITAAPVEVRFGPRTLKIGALKLREFGILQKFIRQNSKKPTVAAKEELEFLPPEDHRATMKAAVIADRDWPPSVGTRDGNHVLFDSDEGQRLFLSTMLRKYQPDLEESVIDEVVAGLSPEDFGLLVTIAFGEDGIDPESVRAAATEALKNAVAQNVELSGGSSSPTSPSEASRPRVLLNSPSPSSGSS